MSDIPRRIDDIEPIKKPRGDVILKRDRIRDLVEKPLIAACEILYDKNIKTLESSANKEDLGRGNVGITIHYDSLSPGNQKIAREHCDIGTTDDWGQVASIIIPITSGMTTEEIQQASIQDANRFEHQPMTWAVTKTIEEVKAMFGNSDEFTLDAFISSDWYRKQGWHYDEETQLFYLSEEHWSKTREDIRGKIEKVLE
jgi:hypothetical protein